MVFVQKSGGLVFISPTANKDRDIADISLTISTETAMDIRDQLNEMFPKENCAVDIAQKRRN